MEAPRSNSRIATARSRLRCVEGGGAGVGAVGFMRGEQRQVYFLIYRSRLAPSFGRQAKVNDSIGNTTAHLAPLYDKEWRKKVAHEMNCLLDAEGILSEAISTLSVYSQETNGSFGYGVEVLYIKLKGNGSVPYQSNDPFGTHCI